MNKRATKSAEAFSMKKEIEGYDIYKKVPLVFNYILESYILDLVPRYFRPQSKSLHKAALLGACIFSTSVVPMLYIYRRDKDSEESSVLSAK